MKTYIKLLLIFSLLFCCNVFAQTDLAGTWQGKLAIDQNTKMTIQFILTKKADGSYSAVLNSPDTGGIKNASASAVKYAGGKLTIDVASLSGSYSGTVGKGIITGEWRQQGSTFPLVLTPYKKPEQSSLKPLIGEWVGKLTAPGITVSIVLRFETTKEGKFAAFMDVPEQSAKGLPVTDVTLEGDQVSLKVPVGQIDYAGKLSGNSINGTFKQGGAEFPLNLAKGKYQALGINMQAEDMKKLMGRWEGKLSPPGAAELTIVFRFETTKDGKLYAFMDVPEQGSKDLPMSDVLLKGDQLSLKVAGGQIEYTGRLSANGINGTYKQRGGALPLNMMKGKYQAPPIDMPPEAMNKLLGQWAGRMNVPGDVIYTIILRFEKTSDGKFAAFADCPERGTSNNRIADVLLKDDQLSFGIPAMGWQYAGKLSANSMSGTCLLNGKQNALNLAKGAKYEAQIAQVDIPAEEMKKLLGRWKGGLGGLSVIFRFERNVSGKNVILVDVPEQNVKSMPVLKASLVDGSLSLKMSGSEYSGKLSGNKIDGSLKVISQGNLTVPLPMTKE